MRGECAEPTGGSVATANAAASILCCRQLARRVVRLAVRHAIEVIEAVLRRVHDLALGHTRPEIPGAVVGRQLALILHAYLGLVVLEEVLFEQSGLHEDRGRVGRELLVNGDDGRRSLVEGTP